MAQNGVSTPVTKYELGPVGGLVLNSRKPETSPNVWHSPTETGVPRCAPARNQEGREREPDMILFNGIPERAVMVGQGRTHLLRMVFPKTGTGFDVPSSCRMRADIIPSGPRT